MGEHTDGAGEFRFRTFEELVAPYQDPDQLRQLIEEDATNPELKAAWLAELDDPKGDAVRRDFGPEPMPLMLAPMSLAEALASYTKDLPPSKIQKIISGGETGADRAGLDWAIARGFEHGGWCPKGRAAEDGVIPAQYDLVEVETPEFWRRTKRNVEESDATVIFTVKRSLTGGSLETQDFARCAGKPCIHLSGAAKYDVAASLRAFISVKAVRVMNVAGAREGEENGIYDFTRTTLDRAFPREPDVPRAGLSSDR